MSKYTINELANSKGVSQLVREALLQMEAELDATNRQVEILSDALAESRRDIDSMIAIARADERDKWMERAHIMILGEREACAKVCEAVHVGAYDTPEFWREGVAYTCAAAIRARGKP